MRTSQLTTVGVAIFLLVTATTSAGRSHQQTVPAFVTMPRLERIGDLPASRRGHLIWGPTGLTPAPAASGAADDGARSLAETQMVSGTANTTNALDSYQGETMLVAGGFRLVGGQNDIYPGNCNAAAATGTFGDCGPSASASSDAGNSWTRTKLTRTWSGHTYLIGFDPSIAFDGVRFFYAYGVADGGANPPNGIVVARSGDGVNWVRKTPVVLHTTSTSIFEDKYWIAADRSSGPFRRSLYVGWDRNQAGNQILLVSFSRPDPAGEAGASWSAPIKVNDGTSPFERVIYAYPAVDQRDGTVYMSWHDYARGVLFVDRSTNGGQSWGADVAAAQTHTGFGTDIGCNGGRLMTPAHHLLVGPGGELYLVYADDAPGNGYDVFVVRSVDGGATWSARVRVNDDPPGTGRHQYNAGASVDPSSGALTISFYDRRDDPGNCRTHVYVSQSVDGGVSFTTNEMVTGDGAGPFGTGQSSYDGNPNGPGDYSGAASVPASPFGRERSHPYYVRHVDPDLASGGGFEAYVSKVTR